MGGGLDPGRRRRGADRRLGATHLWWLLRFRRGFPVDIDEAGYLWFAFTLHDRLRGDGPLGLVREFQNEGWVAPLLPALTAVLEVPAEAGDAVAAMAVQLVFFAVLVLASYGIGERLLDRRAGLVTALVVATMPGVTDFVRTYHLVIPSTAMYALATYALLASNRLRHMRWSIVFGVAVGLMLLSRSMMLAFLPALPLAAAWIVLVDGRDGTQVRNFKLAALAGFATILAWYATSGPKIVHYVVNFGYGGPSANTGSSCSPLSPGLWTHELTRAVNAFLYLPLAAVPILALAVAAAAALARRRDWPSRVELGRVLGRAARSEALVPAIVVVEGYLALTSSRNDGTGFVVPLLPPAVALVVVAALKVPWRAARTALIAAFVLVAAFNVVMKADVIIEASEPREVAVPVFGTATLSNGRGWIHEHLRFAAGYTLGPPTRWLPDRERRWASIHEQVARELGDAERVTVVPEEPLVSASVLRLGGYRAHSDAAFEHGEIGGDDRVAAYEQFLRRERPDAIVTTSRDRPQFAPRINNRLVEQAARSLGYTLERRFPTPDGRQLRVWVRS